MSDFSQIESTNGDTFRCCPNIALFLLWIFYLAVNLAAKCPSTEFEYAREVNMCYWFMLDDEVIWPRAAIDCINKGSHLITVSDYN